MSPLFQAAITGLRQAGPGTSASGTDGAAVGGAPRRPRRRTRSSRIRRVRPCRLPVTSGEELRAWRAGRLRRRAPCEPDSDGPAPSCAHHRRDSPTRGQAAEDGDLGDGLLLIAWLHPISGCPRCSASPLPADLLDAARALAPGGEHQLEVVRAGGGLDGDLLGDVALRDVAEQRLVEGLHAVVVALGDHLGDPAGLLRVRGSGPGPGR